MSCDFEHVYTQEESMDLRPRFKKIVESIICLITDQALQERVEMLSSIIQLYEDNSAEQNEENFHTVSTILSDVANSLNDSYRILNNTVCNY